MPDKGHMDHTGVHIIYIYYIAYTHTYIIRVGGSLNSKGERERGGERKREFNAHRNAVMLWHSLAMSSSMQTNLCIPLALAFLKLHTQQNLENKPRDKPQLKEYEKQIKSTYM